MMGSRKKLFLAALLGAVMVLCFAIGLVPSQMQADLRANAASGATAVAISADGSGPAGDSYSIPVGADQGFSALGLLSDGSVSLLPAGEVEWSLASGGEAALSVADGDLVATVSALAPGEAGLYVATSDGLVDMVNLDLYQLTAEGKVLTALEITSPVDGSQVFVQTGVTGVPLVMTSTVDDPADAGSVTYTFDGDQTATASQPPYAAAIPDVTALTTFTITAAATSYATYDEYSDTVGFSVVQGNFDANGDGLPDDPFGLGLGPNDRFISSVNGKQTVVVGLPGAAKLVDIPAGGVTASVADPGDPSRIVTVVVPGGLVQAGESGVLLLSAADTLDALLGATEAADVSATPAGGLVPGARFAEISILISQDGGTTFQEIDNARLADNPVSVVMEGLTIAPGDNARFFDYPTTIIDTDAGAGVSIAIDAEAAGVWNQTSNGSAVGAGQVSAQLSSLSIVAPFLTPTHLQAVSVTDPFDFSTGGKQVDVVVSNVNIADDVDVFIDGVAAALVNAAPSGSNVVMTVTVPAAAALAAPASSADVDVRIDNNTTGEFDVLVNGFTYNGPDVTSIDPTEGPETGGTAVNITADGLGSLLQSVTIGGAALTNVSVTKANIYGVTTAASPGLADVVVTLNNNYTGTLADSFTYLPGSPVVSSVFPNAVFNDGGYTIRVNGEFFLDPAAQFKAAGFNYVLFTTAYNVYNFGGDVPAAEVEFIDDTKLNALTPVYAGAGLYNVYVATSTYSGAKEGIQISNAVDFTFVDINAAQMEIYDIDPRNGALEGGTLVQITGDGIPPSTIITKNGAGKLARSKGAATGNVVQIADSFAEAGTTNHQVPVSLFREPVGGGSQAPASIDMDVTFDSTVLTGVGFAPSTNLLTWYQKTAATNTANPGVIGVVISGGTFEITTLDDQRLGGTGASENPFLLGNLFFNVVGADGETTPIAVSGLSMATAAAAPITNTASEPGSFSVGCPTTTVDELLSEADSDSNGEVTFAEFQAFLPCGTQADFDALDDNGDGVITADDVPFVVPPCIDVLNDADGNADGSVTFAEFQATYPRGTQADFDGLDTDGDDVITELDCGTVINEVDVYFGPNAGTVRSVQAVSKAYGGYSNSIVRAITPAGERPGAVDVRVVLKADPSIFAISRAFNQYAPAPGKVTRPGDGGFTYDDCSVTSVTPDRTWIFGNETVAINGAGFDPNVSVVYIGDQIAQLDTTQTQSSSTLYVIVPELVGVPNGAPATQVVDVRCECDATKEAILEDGFTYVRYSEDAVTEGTASGTVFTTAFSFDGATGVSGQEIVLNSTASLTGSLSIPAISTQAVKSKLDGSSVKTGGRIFGLARASKVEDLFALENLIGQQAGNIWSFDFHIYRGEAPYDELSVAFATKDVPIKLSFPADDIVPAVSTSDLVLGALLSVETDFDRAHANRATGFSVEAGANLAGDFQSQVLPSEFTHNGGNVVSFDDVRIRSLGTSYQVRLSSGPGSIRAEFAPGQQNRVRPGDTINIEGSGLGYGAIDILDGSDAKSVIPVTQILAQDEFGISFVLPQGVQSGPITVRVKVPVVGGEQNVDLQGLVVPGGGLPLNLLALLAALLGILAGGDGGGGGGTCFIATAAYGTPMAEQIDVLRAVRDEFMLTNPVGTALVDVYYTVSPAIADVVAKHPALAAAVRLVLTPIILLGKVALAMPQVSLGLALMAGALAVLRRKLRRAKRA